MTHGHGFVVPAGGQSLYLLAAIRAGRSGARRWRRTARNILPAVSLTRHR